MPDTQEGTLYGVDLGDAPHDCHVVHALALVEGVEPGTGDAVFVLRLSDGLSTWSALGMIEAAAAQLRREFLESYKDDGG